MMTELVSEKELESLADRHPCLAVLFWAEWSKPCQLFLPHVERAASLAPESTAIARMNADDFPALAEKYGVRSLPTLVMFREGKPVQRSVGLQTATAILEQLR